MIDSTTISSQDNVGFGHLICRRRKLVVGLIDRRAWPVLALTGQPVLEGAMLVVTVQLSQSADDKMRYKYRSHTSDWQELMILDEQQ